MTDTPQTLTGCMLLQGKLNPNHRAMPTVAEFMRSLAARTQQPYEVIRALAEGVERMTRFLAALGRAATPSAPTTKTGGFNYEHEVRVCVHPGATVREGNGYRLADDAAVVLLGEVTFHDEAVSRSVWDKQARKGAHIVSVMVQVRPSVAEAEGG